MCCCCRYLFDTALNLTKRKIESNLIRPVPQIGPLVMEVLNQRQVILTQVMGLDEKGDRGCS